MVFLKEFFEKLFFVKSQQTTTTAQKNYPACKELTSIKELQRQKMEYENKKKVAEQLRRQQEEEDEREQRRRAAMRLQEEQKAMLERQREETRVQEEQARAWEEARKREVHIAGFLSQDKAKPKYEQWHEVSNNVVCATSKGSDQPVHRRWLIRSFASRLSILWLLSYWPNRVWSF